MMKFMTMKKAELAKVKLLAAAAAVPATIAATTVTALANEVNYNEKALDAVNTAIGKVDFSVFFSMFSTVVVACIGATIGVIALKKGIAWLRSYIRGM